MTSIVLYWWILHCFMLGCFFSMANCVSHTCFISFFTSSTSVLYTLPVAFIRFAIWFRLLLVFWEWRCNPVNQSSQCHRHTHTKSGGAGRWICFSCQRFLLSVPVCIAPCHLDIFSVHFCAHSLRFFERKGG